MFEKGDYIVCLNTPKKGTSFPQNFVFKQKIDYRFLMTELDIKGRNNNGWDIVDFEGNEKYGKWRYASPQEIQEYDRIGKPYDTTTLTPGKINYEIY